MDKLILLTEIKSRFNRYNDLSNNFNLILEKQFVARNKSELLEESINEYFKKYFKNIDKPYTKLAEEIKMKKNEYNITKYEFEISVKEKEEFEKANNINELDIEDIENESKEELEEKMNEIDNKINILTDEKNYLKNQIEKLENEIDEIGEIEADIIEKKENLNYFRKYKKINGKSKRTIFFSLSKRNDR